MPGLAFDLLELDSQQFLVDFHRFVYNVVGREVFLQLCLIDLMILTLLDVRVVRDVPRVDLGGRVVKVLLLQLNQFMHLGLTFRVDTRYQVLKEVFDSVRILGHLFFEGVATIAVISQ